MKKRNFILSSILLCGLLCLAFTFDSQVLYWLWSDIKPVAIILTLLTSVLGFYLLKETNKLRQNSQK